MIRSKIIDVEKAIEMIPDDITLCIGGGGAGHAVPDKLLQGLGRRYREKGSPRNLTVLHPCGIGDNAERGLNHIAHAGLVKRAVGGFWGNSPKMGMLARGNEIEGYNFPQGVLSHLTRACAAGEPGVITSTGLYTFVDPRIEGGKLNDRTKEDLVKVVTIEDKEYLLYKSMNIDFAFIRGTAVDKEGNLSMTEEVGTFAMLSIAQAAKRNKGTVIAQVKRVQDDRHFDPVHVKVPGVFIDYVVLDPEQGMTFISSNEPALVKRDAPYEAEALTLDGVPRIIARRSAAELFAGAFVNLGYGMPDGVPIIANEENVLKDIIFMIEQGAIGGIPTTGLNFGAMYHPTAIVDDGYQFDFFHGGGLDLAFLGFAQVDRRGNVNSSRFGSHLTGCGGFIDISQNAKKVIFCGTFAVKGASEIENGKLKVIDRGKFKKFVADVQQITFSGKYAGQIGQKVLYVTERAVFELTPDGLLLKEIAPGVDVQKDILEMMDFKPILPDDIQTMDSVYFTDEPLKLKKRFIG